MRNKLRERRKEITYKPEEWEKIVKLANSAELKPATYIKRISLNGSVNFYDFKELIALLNGLRIIGGNINQLARKANELNCIYADDYERMKQEYSSLCSTLNRIATTLRS
ncbi:MAG: plasmid mobilization relaxosome protein MobC [Ruminiclostridium sp.]|nr:plasmid mobilization relaxosome protein MobC [Ruminiclostridium sp.]